MAWYTRSIIGKIVCSLMYKIFCQIVKLSAYLNMMNIFSK